MTTTQTAGPRTTASRTASGGDAGKSSIAGREHEFLTFVVDKQTFGLPLHIVDDVLDARPLTRIPLSPPEVAGSLNLRGRIITAIDVRRRLGLPAMVRGAKHMSIVVEHDGEVFTLIVDAVGEVLAVTADQFEENPVTLDEQWRQFSVGIYRLDSHLMVILNIEALFDIADESGLW